MSQFYDSASLVLVPSGYKSGKIYSQKPLSTSGELSFSRASNATRVVLDASGQQRLEKVRTNLVTYSEDFSNAAWVKSGTTSITATGVTDPNGGTTAVTVSFPSLADELYQLAGLLTGEFTNSIYVKGTAGETIAIWGISTSGGYQLKTLTGAWQRISNTNTLSSATGYMALGRALTAATATSVSIAFAQAEMGVMTDYIATTSAAVSVGPVSGLPRLDYSGGASCPSLLLEPQRTNSVIWSEQIDNAGWTKINAPTITTNIATAPDGYGGADGIQDTTGGSFKRIRQSFSITPNSTNTVSVFVKKETSETNYGGLALSYSNRWAYGIIDAVNGTMVISSDSIIFSTSVKVDDYGDWWRFSLTATDNQSNSSVYVDYYATLSTNGTSTGLGAGSVRTIWGFQLEVGASYATSYIPTLSSAVTRVNDYTSKASSTIAADAKTWFCDANITEGNASPNVMFLTLRGGPYEGYFRYFDSNALSFQYYGAVGSVSIGLPNAIPAGTTQRVKMAARVEDNNIAFYVNGVQVGTETGATRGTGMNLLEIGTYGTGSQYCISDSINQVLLFPTALSNADLATLTTL